MGTSSKYTLRRTVNSEHPPIDVLEGPGGILVATFGRGSYNNNVESMRAPRSNPHQGSRVLRFSPADSRLSIDVTAYDF